MWTCLFWDHIQPTIVIKALLVTVSAESLAHDVEVQGAGYFWSDLEVEGGEQSCELGRPIWGHV